MNEPNRKSGGRDRETERDRERQAEGGRQSNRQRVVEEYSKGKLNRPESEWYALVMDVKLIIQDRNVTCKL